MAETMQHTRQREAVIADKAVFGFWIYLMTDLVMFAVLFAAYSVLHGNVFGGPSGSEIFNLPFALTETMILLFSSFTCGLAMLAVRRGDKTQVLLWLAVTFLMGMAFLGLELQEFSSLVSDGNSWQKSAFLSSYFSLVGTHGLHITAGLFWMFFCTIKVWSQGITPSLARKLTLFSLFWHFLDIVWIFIFTIVYLMSGV